MQNYRYFSFFFLVFSFSVYANEEVFIDSIESTQGAGITCSEPENGFLRLDIFGEMGKRSITVTKKEKYLYFSDIDVYYGEPIYQESKDIFYVLEKIRNIYFLNGEFVTRSIGFSDEEQEAAKNTYDLMKEALSEAHQKGVCKDWSL